jgi:DNA-binding transcriptional LysR family regulator
MDTLVSLKVFRQVVELRSFVGAAERLDMSTAMASKHVMHVERRLGVRLLNRNTRSLSLTEPGRVYFERCKALLRDLEETEMELGSLGAVPSGTLRVTCPSWFASERLADCLAAYRERFPQVVIDASFEDRFVDLVEEGYDLALRVTASNAPSPEALPAGVVARAVRPVPFLVGASRDYLKRKGVPQSPAELATHDCVAAGNMHTWEFGEGDGHSSIPAKVVLRYRSMAGVPTAIAAGLGVASLPETLFEEPTYRDVLVPVLTEYPLRQPRLYMVHVSRRHVPSKVRTFIDFFLERNSGQWRPRLPAAQAARAIGDSRAQFNGSTQHVRVLTVGGTAQPTPS